eukprot:m.91855 g.91855  ORF g.91855 m.91855 type:complete len:224 (+) comp15053_c0_seq5:340-1011(+)
MVAGDATGRRPSQALLSLQKRTITVFENGNPLDDGHELVAVGTLKQVLRSSSHLLGGKKVVQLIAQDLATKITRPEQLRNGRHYLACGTEPIDRESLPRGFERVVRHQCVIDVERIKEEYRDFSEKQIESAVDQFNVFDQQGTGKAQLTDATDLVNSSGCSCTPQQVDVGLEALGIHDNETFDFYEFLSLVRVINRAKTKGQRKKQTSSSSQAGSKSRVCSVQ